MQKIPTFYRDKSLFAVEISSGSVKLVQTDAKRGKRRVVAYGYNQMPQNFVRDGEIVLIKETARLINQVMTEKLSGKVSGARVAASIPTKYTYNRVMYLPKLKESEIEKAALLEIEQYVPVAIDELYVSYQILPPRKGTEEREVLITAAPKNIIDSLVKTFETAGLEVAFIEPSINALNRLVNFSDDVSTTTLLMDIGFSSIDLCIVDKVVRVTGTVRAGSEQFTESVAKKLKISSQAANTLKFKYGLNKSEYQEDIRQAIQPYMEDVMHEVNKIIRFYNERAKENHQVSQVITTGGGAAMPGISEYLINTLRMPVRMCSVWHKLDFHGVNKPSPFQSSVFATAVGLALLSPEDIRS